MIFAKKKPSEITLDLLLKHAGDHARYINTDAAHSYKDRLVDVFKSTVSDGPLDIILPGFPYKSANRTDKVLGKLPDLGEEIALSKLEKLRSTLARKLNRPIHLTICSDGFAFNDLKGIDDKDVLAYRAALAAIAEPYPYIKIKTLNDLIPDRSCKDRRANLMSAYGTNIDALASLVASDEKLSTLYNNLTIFAKHDLTRLEGETKKAFKARSKETALHVLARSKAWASLIADHYPNAIRLSIHPYTDVSEKFPVSLLPSVDGRWRTPWHNVPVITGSTPFNTAVKLTPKREAENSGAFLNYHGSRPWSYTSHETKLLEETMKCGLA